MNKDIAIVLSTLKSCSAVGTPTVMVPYSGSVTSFVDLLYRNGYIAGFRRIGYKLQLHISYDGTTPNISQVTIYSSPSRRLFISYKKLLEKYALSDCVIVSTVRGYMTLVDAYQIGLGGQIICKIN